ncbi:unnamed protein product [Anisakis simplex]|uniref:ANF_receptor domain-containing protein n=1 Tax=Anisakis simplex TaxID=6269 RepID=A0A0M3J263_ANISI|nr:unnamed protein product [Anisakis simplex]
MAGFWNIPIIAYMTASNSLTDKNIYKTLSRISMRSTNSFAEATAALLNHYKWLKVALVTNTGSVAYERVTSFEEVFAIRGISVVKRIMFDENADSAAMRSTGLIHELRNNARIIICVFSSTRQQSREFMSATSSERLQAKEFVFILPWLQDGSRDASPWVGPDGEMQQKIKDQYANAIIIDDVNGFDNTVVQPFLERIELSGLKQEDVDIVTDANLFEGNIYAYLYLFDALKLYVLAAQRTYNSTGDPMSIRDGRLENYKTQKKFNAMNLIPEIQQSNISGMLGPSGVASGKVTMDDRADRAPLYRAFFVSPLRDQALPMVNMEPTFVNGCDGLINRSGCYEIVITDLMTGFWPSADGSMPLDDPVCGFRGEKCDYTLLIICGALVVFVICCASAIFGINRYLLVSVQHLTIAARTYLG